VAIDNTLMTFDAATGAVGWTYQALSESARILAASSPAVSGDTVVASFGSGELVALRAANGNDLWSEALSRASRTNALSEIRDIPGRPVIYKGDVFAVSHSGVFAATDLRTGQAYGREALMRGMLGNVELRGAELLAAAEAHDALFSFDYRARAAALEVGLPLLPPGEILFVNVDPRASLDVESTMRTTWPVVGRLGADPSRLCLELVKPERCLDRDLLLAITTEHRKRGAKVALDDLSGGPDSLACLELIKPDVAKIDTALTSGIQHSVGRRALVKALVECAHELGTKVVAEGIERVDEFRAMAELGVDLGQGYYFGHPTEKPMAVEARLVRPNGL
jgi:EAL domain-containing protein (putative c-di-GMP-specific phosphodiesterase class I)